MSVEFISFLLANEGLVSQQPLRLYGRRDTYIMVLAACHKQNGANLSRLIGFKNEFLFYSAKLIKTI